MKLKDFSGANLIVAGEVGIDEYLWGDTRRISPEAPVPVVEVDSREFKLGLAANVAQNIVSLGAKATLITVSGEDEEAKQLAEMVESARLKDSIVIKDASRPTLRKTRVIAQKQHVVRIDFERSHALDAHLAKSFTDAICDNLPKSDGIIVQDYGKGIWNPDTMAFVKEARARKKPIFVDPSRSRPLTLYSGATLLTPNVAEAEVLCSYPPLASKVANRDEARLREMAGLILERTLADHAVITCGEEGMFSLSRNSGNWLHIPTFAREVFDVTGAGDTVIAVIALMKVLGEPLDHCLQVANAAAGLVVGQSGTASVTPQQLHTELERLENLGLISSIQGL